MSTAAPSSNRQSRSNADQLIDDRIEEARRALWWSELTRAVLKIVIGSMSALLVWLVVDHWIYAPSMAVRLVCFLVFLGVIAWYLARRTWPLITQQISREYAAWALEKDHPDYRQQLTSYVTLKADSPQGIRARVVQAIGSRAASLLKTYDVLPGEATGTFRWWIATAAVFALLAAYIVASPKSSVASAKRLGAPLSSVAPAKRVQIRRVAPGNVQALAGRSIDVSAEIDGLFSNEPAICYVQSDTNESSIPLVFETDRDLFVATIEIGHAATGLVNYRIEAGDAIAGPFSIRIQNVPVVAIESVRYEPPAYTGAQPRTTSSPAINTSDGTNVRLTAKTNHAVKRAELELNCKEVGGKMRPTGGTIKMKIADDGVTLSAEMVMRSSVGRPNAVEPENYRIRVWDHADQTNPEPIVYPIKIIPDLPPDVTIVVPRKSPKEVPFDGQQTIEVHAMDADYELEQVSLKIVRGLDTIVEPIIWKREASGKGNQVAVYRFRPFLYRLGPGDVVRVTATAVDNRQIPGDERVKPNRVTTDPVELRIVDTDPDLPEDPTDNDGLSKPDDRPATNADGGDSGEGQPSGGGTSGSEGTEGESSDENNGGSGQSASGASGENESESESSSSDSNSSGQSGEDSNPQENPSNDVGDETSDGSSGGKTSNSGESPNSDNADGNESPAAERQDPGDASTDQSTSGGDQADSTMNASAEDEASGGQSTQSETSDGQHQSDSADQDGSQDDAAKPSAPEHDGEAFERIKDYLERNQKDSQSGQSGSRQAEENPNQKPENSDQGGDQQAGSEQSQSSPSSSDSGSSPDGSSQDETGNRDQQSGSESSSESQAGTPKADPSAGQEGAGEMPKDQSPEAADSEQSGQPESGQPESGQPESGQPESGQTEDANSDTRPSTSENTPSGDSSGGEQGNQTGEDDNGSDQGTPADETPRDDPSSSAQDRPSGSSESSSSSSGQPSSDSSPQAGDQTNPNGTGSAPGEGDRDAEPPPPPDLDYAKKATDMVLDYLDENRDKIDDDLLEELNWTPEDLERFRKRWENVRDIDQPTADPNRTSEAEDALRSLGLEPREAPQRSNTRPRDTMRDVRDSGNRRRVPASIRDAFDAFRRR
ncbi:hypothetical protein [Roseiconus lacunae]|uniref:hypothetical protein n=1 Tax=Roseiconus lacunae TaxID=2605694 RepID=UPI0011F2D5B5|nr:hypothetical protein [Roseiconus lacunae]